MKIVRILTAAFGGYLLSALFSATISLILPFDIKAQSIVLASMLSFMIWLLFILYCFSSVSIKSLIIQLVILCTVLFLINTYLLPIKG